MSDIMLNESNSSFDTTPSFDFVMRQEGGRDVALRPNMIDDDDDDDDDEDYDVITGENEERDDMGGVLILPPTMAGSSEDSRNPTILSIPDSVPTVMDSALLLDLPECVHVVDTTAALAAPDTINPLQSNLIPGNKQEGTDRTVPSSLEIQNEACAASPNTWRRNVLTLVLLAAMSTGSIGHALYLHRESLLLKEQVQLLTDQAARAEATLDELQQKQAREVAFDTCWLQAKMSLGECSEEVKENVKETVHTYGSYIQDVWDKMNGAYQETMQKGAKGFETLYHFHRPNILSDSYFQDLWDQAKAYFEGSTKEGTKASFHSFYQFFNPPNISTNNIFGARMNALWEHWNNGRVVNTTTSLHDIWNYTKGIFCTFNMSFTNNSFGSNVRDFWSNVTESYKDKMDGKVHDVGQSLCNVPASLIDILKTGYDELKDSVRQSQLYWTTPIHESNATSSDTDETDSLGNFLPKVKDHGLQSRSKKVLVAAAWSAGAAILVSTFDMYWNQHGKFPALEN